MRIVALGRLRLSRTLWNTVLTAAVAAGASLAHARPDPEPQPKPEVQTLFVGERGVCADLFVSDKDAALRKALEMLPERIRELHAQIPELHEVPEEARELVLSILMHPMRVAITNKGFDQQTGMPGIGAVISMDLSADGEAGAQKMHESIEKLRAMRKMPFEPEPSKRFQGMTDLPLPVGVLSYGPRNSASGWRYEFIFAAIDDPDAPFTALPRVPDGVKPVVRGSIDLAAWSPIVSMFAGFAAMASPQGQQVIDQLRSAGLIGPDAMKMEWSLGHSAEQMQGTFAVRRLGKHAAAMTKATLSDEDFSAIPADASYVDIAKFDLKKQWEAMQAQLQQMGGDEFRAGLDEMKQALGFDPETEIIDALSDTIGLYFSDSTGGGSMMSGVMMIALAQPERVLGALSKAATNANAMFDREVQPPAAVEVARFERDGISFTQLRFPGLPVPIEPTIAVAGKWMLIGATPQAATSAARHVMQAKAGGGLLSNKAFTTARWAPPGGAGTSVIHFADPARTMRDGYATLTFLGAAIENAARTRSLASAAREPGMVLPLYADLLKDTRPMMMISYWEGDDFITDVRGDRSILATLATMLGIGDAMPFIAGAAMGGAIGANAAEEAGMQGYADEGDEVEDEPTEDEDEAEEPATKEKTPY